MALRLTSSESEDPDDYELTEDTNSAWVKVGVLVVHVLRTDEGVIADIYKDGDEMADPLASAYAFFSEADVCECGASLDDGEGDERRVEID